MNAFCPKTKSYLKAYERWLRKRSTLSTRMTNAPFYVVYNVGSYTFAPYKVIWAEQSGTFEAAVAAAGEVPLFGQRPYVSDHKIFFVEFQKADPAHYLCGLLASSLVKEFVESHNISIQVGNIFKHMSLPSFDRTKHSHKRLAQLVERAHQEHDATVRAALVGMLVFPLLKSLLPVVVAFLLPTTDTLDHRRVGTGTHRHGLFQEPMEELPAMA